VDNRRAAIAISRRAAHPIDYSGAGATSQYARAALRQTNIGYPRNAAIKANLGSAASCTIIVERNGIALLSSEPRI